ncbi:TPA: Ig-like domain-containing protein [Photobacterium damselae]
MNYFKKAASILLVAFLTACGGGGDSDNGSNNNVVGKVDNPIAANIIKSVLVESTGVAYKSSIDLNEKVIDPNNLSLKIDDYSMTGSGCSASVDGLVFNIESSRESVCNISYSVTNVLDDGTKGKASTGTISNIFSSFVDPYLPTISLAAEVGSQHAIDLRAELGDLFPNGAQLESDIFYTAGRSIVTPEISTPAIIVSAGAEPEVVQIRYSLKDSAEKVKFGIITVTVSDNLNLAPTAAKKYLEIEPNQTEALIVDVSSLISDSDNSVNELQLLSVDSFDNVAYIPQSNAEIINNKVFEVKAPTPGTYDITYTVTDHNGGYASAIIRVFVKTKLPWEDILLTDGKLYTAPWEKSIADAYGLLYDSFYEETINGVLYSVPTFTQSYASTLCMSRGMMLPTVRMLDYLYSQKGDVKISDGWPTDDLYWTSDSDMAYNLKIGKEVAIPVNSPELHTFTCVYPGLLSTSIILDKAYTSDSLSTRNFNEVSVHLSDLFASPVPNQLVSMFPQEYPSDLVFDSNVILTNVNGNGSFKIQSPSAGVVSVCAKYLSQRLCESIEFIKDSFKKFYVTPASTELIVTKSTRLSAWIQYDSGNYNVTSQVSSWLPNNDIVTVDSTGLVTGAKVGTSLVSAIFKDDLGVDRVASSVITVKDGIGFCEVRPDRISLNVGESKKLTLWCTHLTGNVVEIPANDTSWSTTSSNIRIDANGNVTALSYSPSDILVKANMKSQPSYGGQATVNITDTIQSCRLDPNSASLNVGGEQQLTMTCQYSSGSKTLAPNQVNWISSNSSVVSINTSTGRAKAEKFSSSPVIITASPKDNTSITTSSVITVNNTVNSCSLRPGTATVKVGSEQQLILSCQFDSGSRDLAANEVSWSSSNASVVSINTSTGKARAEKYSSSPVTITARPKANTSLSATSTITVEEDNSWGTNGYLEVTPDKTSGIIGQTYSLKAIAHTKNGQVDVTSSAIWTSSGVGSVNKGVVSSDRMGLQTVTATYTLNGIQKSATASVGWNTALCLDGKTTTYTSFTNPGSPAGTYWTHAYVALNAFEGREFGNKTTGGTNNAIFAVSGLRYSDGTVSPGTPILVAKSDNIKKYRNSGSGNVSLEIQELYDYTKPAWFMIELTATNGDKCTIAATLVPN